jgi:DNA replication and repair protein RecF
LSVEFLPQINIFHGQNGQGKTNLLEALYLMTQGESFRYGDNYTFIQHNCREALLKTQIQNQDLDWDLQLQVLKSKKNHFANGKKITATSASEKFPVIIFSPESLSAIKEGDDQRRLLVDSLLSTTHLGLATTLQSFRKVLKSRNRIIKDHLQGQYTSIETQNLLESINPSYLELATKVTYARIEALRAIVPDFNEAMSAIGKRNNVDISVEYVISGENALEFDQKMVFDSLRKRLHELASAELASGSTLVGPQKHDLKFLYNQNDSRFFCSQGQQRALILSFKMAQIVYHRRVHKNEPVLMLDDVLSELDLEKRSALISFLNQTQTQIFISTTDLTLPEEIVAEMRPKGMAVFNIANGKILERSVI